MSVFDTGLANSIQGGLALALQQLQLKQQAERDAERTRQYEAEVAYRTLADQQAQRRQAMLDRERRQNTAFNQRNAMADNALSRERFEYGREQDALRSAERANAAAMERERLLAEEQRLVQANRSLIEQDYMATANPVGPNGPVDVVGDLDRYAHAMSYASPDVRNGWMKQLRTDSERARLHEKYKQFLQNIEEFTGYEELTSEEVDEAHRMFAEATNDVERERILNKSNIRASLNDRISRGEMPMTPEMTRRAYDNHLANASAIPNIRPEQAAMTATYLTGGDIGMDMTTSRAALGPSQYQNQAEKGMLDVVEYDIRKANDLVEAIEREIREVKNNKAMYEDDKRVALEDLNTKKEQAIKERDQIETQWKQMKTGNSEPVPHNGSVKGEGQSTEVRVDQVTAGLVLQAQEQLRKELAPLGLEPSRQQVRQRVEQLRSSVEMR
ncbi:MAG: hypothetical protein H6815_00395 [Phycisphaeraceae bacterium]|nr:hypothetical protein [Phycisphaerales bacterium]MCB9858883.1 hypothetical protein [Phycisphaeraceae bacterium]